MKTIIFTFFTLLSVIIDQVTKHFTLTNLKPIGTKEIIKGFFSLTYVENRGAAFGILQNARYVFIIATIIAVCAIIVYMLKFKPNNKILLASLSLILSGAVGNMIDRIFRGYVVDMFEVTFIDYPVFNFADCCVVVGAILLAIYTIFIYKEPVKGEKTDE